MENNYKKSRQVHESSTYTDFANVEVQRNYVFPETFPEGPYGSPVNKKLGKTSPWTKNQRPYSRFTYENKTLHQNLPRQFPGAHPTHDDPDKHEEYLDTSK